MSFWDLSEGGSAKDTGGSFEVSAGNMDPIPAGSSVLAMIEEIKWDKRQNTFEEFISARWTVLAPEEFKNRKVFHKLWVTDLDPQAKDQDKAIKKRDKARKMLAAIDANAGGKLTQSQGTPTTDALQSLANKPMIITLEIVSNTDRDGNTRHNNWVRAVASKAEKEIAIGEKKALPTGGAASGSRDDFGTAQTSTAKSVDGDEIPW